MRSVPRSARELLALARAKHHEAAGSPPVIRGLKPSRAAWGEEVLVSGDFPRNAQIRVALRSGGRVFALTPGKPTEGGVRVRLPEQPDGGPDAVVAELFVVVARQPSRPCRLTISAGPVLRRIRRARDGEWVLEGANFGNAVKAIKVEAAGAPKVRMLAATNREIRVRATLADRAPVRVRVGDRVSNSLQARG